MVLKKGLQQGAFDDKVSIIVEMVKSGISKELAFKIVKTDDRAKSDIHKILKKNN